MRERATVATMVAIGVAVAAVAALLPAASPPPAYSDHGVQDFDGLTVVFIGLGTKGDSTLVILPNDRTVLIDGGMPAAYPSIRATLQSFDVDVIDTMIATHPDQDHVAGLSALLGDGSVAVREVLVGPTSKDTKTYQKFLRLADGETVAWASDRIQLDPSVEITVLSPPESMIRSGSNASHENSNSVVTLLEYGDIEFLFTADATHTTERWLIQNYPADVLDVDIMNAPHHGSKHASTEGFIGATSPGVVVFSAERDNQYGHPHAEAVARYQSAGVQHVYVTQDRNVTIQTDGTDCSIMTAGGGEIPCFDGVRAVSSSSAAPAPPEPASAAAAAAAAAASPGAAADGTRTKQKSVEVTIADQPGSVHVKHVIRPTAEPVRIDLVGGGGGGDGSAVEDLTFAAGGTDGGGAVAVPPSMRVGDNDAVVVGPSEAETVVRYVLRDAVVARDGLWTLDFSYPGVTTAFMLPEGLDLVFVNGNPVHVGDRGGINCHGCYMTLEYPPVGRAVTWEAAWEEDRFAVEIRSVPEVSDPRLDQPAKTIAFDTSQANQSVTAIIPRELLGGPYSVLLDGQVIQSHEYFDNGTHAWLNVRPAAPGEVAIVGTTVIPEFPAAVALAAVLLAAILVIVPLAGRRNGGMAAVVAGPAPR